MMSLWSIFRSPLIMGGEMRNNDDFTLSLLTNAEILRMQRFGTNAHQVYRTEKACVWKSTDQEDGSVYAALFNLSDSAAQVTACFEELEIAGTYQVRDLWAKEDKGTETEKLSAWIAPHGAVVYRLKK